MNGIKIWEVYVEIRVNFFFFFFKQKTAYEIVSRDWSSDVCSSDLGHHGPLDAVDLAMIADLALRFPVDVKATWA